MILLADLRQGVASAPIWFRVVIVITVIATLARFVGLESSPPGFYVDEAAISAQVICARQSSENLAGERWPLFTQVLGEGYVTPVYLYSAVAWTAVFGDSVGGIRALAALYGALTVAGVFALALALWRDPRVAWLSALCAAISPWSFLFSRIAWDPPLAPCFLVWGLALLMRSGRHQRWTGGAGGALVALACYAYPPTRIHAALVVPAFLAFIYCFRRESRVAIVPFVLAAALVSLPLLERVLTGEIQGRANTLAIWNADYLRTVGVSSIPSIVKLFGTNMALNFAPTYLWSSGDANLRHSTQAVGQWSWLEVAALGVVAIPAIFAMLFRTREQSFLMGLVVWGYVSAVVPAALAWESNPHALRSIGAYPFLALAAGVVLARAVAKWPNFAFVIPTLAGAFFAYYSVDFFARYPERAARWFDSEIVESARHIDARPAGRSLETEIKALQRDYPDMAIKYYQLRAGKMRCG